MGSGMGSLGFGLLLFMVDVIWRVVEVGYAEQLEDGIQADAMGRRVGASTTSTNRILEKAGIATVVAQGGLSMVVLYWS